MAELTITRPIAGTPCIRPNCGGTYVSVQELEGVEIVCHLCHRSPGGAS